MPLLPEYDLELNIKDINMFLIFPMVICTPWYDKWFRSYGILMSTGLRKLYPGQNQVSCEIWTFTPNRMQSQETSKTNIIANFLSFPMATHVPQFD
jgi:hypothetical protein